MKLCHPVVADLDKYCPIVTQKPPRDIEPVLHEDKPCRKFEIGVVGERILVFFYLEVVWWININTFYPSFVLLKQRRKCQQIISLYNEVICVGKLSNSGNAGYGILFCIDQHFRIKEAINLIRRKGFVVKNLVSFLVFFGLTALKDTVLVGECQYDIFRRGNQIAATIDQTDAIFEACVTVRQELTIVDDPAEADLIENQCS